MDPVTTAHTVFDFHEFLRIVFGTLISGTLLALGFLARDYFKFKVTYARESLTRDKWEELCKQYRGTCDARICKKLDSITKFMDGSTATLSDLAKDLVVVKTKIEPQIDKLKEIDSLKSEITHLNIEIEGYKLKINEVDELKAKITYLENELKRKA